MTRTLLITIFGAVAAFAPRVALAQAPTEIKGEAILKHPIGVLAMRATELLSTGKIEEAVALESSDSQAEWKKESAADRAQLAENRKERAPSAAVLSDAIRKSGVLQITGDRASIEATTAAGDIMAMFARENAQWRLVIGPMILGGGPSPAVETKLEREAILKHPIGELVLRYADVIQRGTADETMRLASSEAQAEWKKMPAGERSESFAFKRRMTPPRAQLEAAIRAGGVLFIGDDTRATLNVVRTEQTSSRSGVSTSSSTTVMIPFVKENGTWKLAQ